MSGRAAGTQSQIEGTQVERRQRFAVTARDLEMVRWLARVRFATTAQVQSRFALEQAKAYRRLRGLWQHGLIDRERLLHNQPRVHYATRAGLDAAGLEDLPVATVSLQSFTHEQAVVWQQVALERRDLTVLSEREMRQHERWGEGPFSVQLGRVTKRNREQLHRPDLAARIDDAWCAVEVELTAKTPDRTREIMRAFRRSQTFDSVLYFVPSQLDAERVQRMAVECEMSDELDVLVISEPEST